MKFGFGGAGVLEQGTVLQGRYQILGKLGEGGMGQVYQAQHLKLGIPVALKTLLLGEGTPGYEERQAQFEHEGRLLASLSHPTLARVMDFFEEGPTGYLAMEYIEGTTLEGVVRDQGPLAEGPALDWAFQMLDALAYLHSCTPPVIVRDLKPSNIMVGPDGRVRIIDFGIAKLLQDGQQTRTVARAATSEGYAPLEQYGMGGTDQRSDLYSLGATLLFMLTGQHPPDAVSRVTQGAPLGDPTALNPTVTSATWNGIQKLMAISQSDRPASTAEARAVLVHEGAGGSDPAPTRSASTPQSLAAASPHPGREAPSRPAAEGPPPAMRSAPATGAGAPSPLPPGDDPRPAGGPGASRSGGSIAVAPSPPTVLAGTNAGSPGIPAVAAVEARAPGGRGGAQPGGARKRVLVIIVAVILGLGSVLVSYQQHQASVREQERVQAEETRRSEIAHAKAEKARQEEAARVKAEKARQEEAARLRAEQERAAELERSYQADAQKPLEALGRLEARTDIGINYRDYKEMLGGVHYLVKEFMNKYETRPESRRSSYKCIAESNQRLYIAGEAWKVKIEADSDDYDTRTKAESLLQQNWKMAGALITEARKALEKHE